MNVKQQNADDKKAENRIEEVLPLQEETAETSGNPHIENTTTRTKHKSQPVSDRPIYTVPRHTVEYQKRRQEQYERGLSNLLEAICIFGGALVLYFILRWIF